MMCCILSLVSSLAEIGSPLYARARSRSTCPKASPSIHVHTVQLSDIYNKQKLANDVVHDCCCLVMTVIEDNCTSDSNFVCKQTNDKTIQPHHDVVWYLCKSTNCLHADILARRSRDEDVCDKSAVLQTGHAQA